MLKTYTFPRSGNSIKGDEYWNHEHLRWEEITSVGTSISLFFSVRRPVDDGLDCKEAIDLGLNTEERIEKLAQFKKEKGFIRESQLLFVAAYDLRRCSRTASETPSLDLLNEKIKLLNEHLRSAKAFIGYQSMEIYNYELDAEKGTD